MRWIVQELAFLMLWLWLKWIDGNGGTSVIDDILEKGIEWIIQYSFVHWIVEKGKEVFRPKSNFQIAIKLSWRTRSVELRWRLERKQKLIVEKYKWEEQVTYSDGEFGNSGIFFGIEMLIIILFLCFLPGFI